MSIFKDKTLLIHQFQVWYHPDRFVFLAGER